MDSIGSGCAKCPAQGLDLDSHSFVSVITQRSSRCGSEVGAESKTRPGGRRHRRVRPAVPWAPVEGE